ncbi:MAG: ABC transporter substrate-binding protein, partial [Alphaproteobacteria bacterium]|nr:ABC transporter substrate-binding protein [Alphaproteobacteria bacterium]
MRNFYFISNTLSATRAFRLAFATLVVAAVFAASPAPAMAANPAEQFITDNVQKGLTILNDKQLSTDLRRSKFRDFLLGLTDIKKIADYTLGQYRRGAPPAALDAYEASFKEYALAVYQSYFAKYSGQTLKVTGSYPLAADETIVKTVMLDPNGKDNAKPLEVNFRVLNEGGRLVVVDFSVEGVWVRELERNDFTS